MSTYVKPQSSENFYHILPFPLSAKGEMKVNFHSALLCRGERINGNLCGNFASSSSSPILEAVKCTQRSFMTVNFISPRNGKLHAYQMCKTYNEPMLHFHSSLIYIQKFSSMVVVLSSAHTIFSGHKSMLRF